MAHRWICLPDGTFTDGLDVWDFIQLFAKDFNPGTKIVIRRPRLGQQMSVAVAYTNIQKVRYWRELRKGDSSLGVKDVVRYDSESLPFEAGDEVEIVHQPSSSHVLS